LNPTLLWVFVNKKRRLFLSCLQSKENGLLYDKAQSHSNMNAENRHLDRKTVVVSFRLTPEQASKLQGMWAENPTVGVNSIEKYARHIVVESINASSGRVERRGERAVCDAPMITAFAA
jgi:hypothetical protein